MSSQRNEQNDNDYHDENQTNQNVGLLLIYKKKQYSDIV